MWFYLLAALAFSNGVSCQNRECEYAAQIKCEKKVKANIIKLPETKEETEDACLSLEQMPQCITKLEENCTDDVLEAYGREMTQAEWSEMYDLREFFSNLQSICQKYAYINSAEFRESVCESRANKKCRVETALPNKIPGTEKELEKACQKLYAVTECLSDSKKECIGSEESFDEEDERKLLSADYIEHDKQLIGVLTDICQKDSDLHEGFVPNLACYSRMMEQEQKEETCNKYVSNSFELLELRITRKATSAGQASVHHEYRHCLRQVFIFNCFALKSDKACGHRARDILLEIFQRVVDLNYVCPQRILVDVLELINDQEMVTTNKVFTKSLLPNGALF